MNHASQWFELQKWQPHAFQKETWKALKTGDSGLLNAPTGSGKTYALWFGMLENLYNLPSASHMKTKHYYCCLKKHYSGKKKTS
ncbi:MAG: DEAD/DEAH box helicase [Cytophagaceae bacterium]